MVIAIGVAYGLLAANIGRPGPAVLLGACGVAFVVYSLRPRLPVVVRRGVSALLMPVGLIIVAAGFIGWEDRGTAAETLLGLATAVPGASIAALAVARLVLRGIGEPLREGALATIVFPRDHAAVIIIVGGTLAGLVLELIAGAFVAGYLTVAFGEAQDLRVRFSDIGDHPAGCAAMAATGFLLIMAMVAVIAGLANPPRPEFRPSLPLPSLSLPQYPVNPRSPVPRFDCPFLLPTPRDCPDELRSSSPEHS